MKRRVLFMHQVSTIGGGSYCLLNILKVVDRSHIEPVVCLAGDGHLRKEIETLGIKVLVFPQMMAVPYNRTLWSLKSIKSYCKIKSSIRSFQVLLNENHIDVVYLNNMMIYPYLKPAKECGCKTIIHCREHWPLDEHTIQLQWARNAVDMYADELVVINKYSASIFPGKNATIVYDWIDMDSRFENRPLCEIFGEDMTNKKVYLYTGGVQRIKGAVEVLKTFSKCVVDPNARLLVVGINPNIAMNGIKHFLAKIGVKSYYYQVKDAILNDKRIVCIPATYMLSHIMQQCYCNLSYFTIPHANLAMAECEIMGTPSITADNEEAREYSMNSQLSLLYQANSLSAFEKAVMSFDSVYESMKDNLELLSDDIRIMFSPKENITRLNRVISNLL